MPISVSGKVAYVPGSRFRELLNELDYPLPTTTFSGTLPVDFAATPRVAAALRPGTVRTAAITDRGPVKAVDTLPPLKLAWRTRKRLIGCHWARLREPSARPIANSDGISHTSDQ